MLNIFKTQRMNILFATFRQNPLTSRSTSMIHLEIFVISDGMIQFSLKFYPSMTPILIAMPISEASYSESKLMKIQMAQMKRQFQLQMQKNQAFQSQEKMNGYKYKIYYLDSKDQIIESQRQKMNEMSADINFIKQFINTKGNLQLDNKFVPPLPHPQNIHNQHYQVNTSGQSLLMIHTAPATWYNFILSEQLQHNPMISN